MRTGSKPRSARSYGAARMSSSRMSRASSKQSATRSELHHRRQPEGVLVEVHPGVQAARLLEGRPVVAAGGERVQRPGLGGEEPERVEVRAADPVRLDDRVGAVRPEPQRPVVPGLVLAPVDHRPLVQPEAAERRRARRGRGEQPVQRLEQRPLGGDVLARVTAIARSSPRPYPLSPAYAAASPASADAVPRVPAPQLRRPLGVVGEQEVVHRVLDRRPRRRQVRRARTRRPARRARPRARATSPRRARSQVVTGPA